MARRKNSTTALLVPVCVICILIWVRVLAQSYLPEPTHNSIQGMQVDSIVEGTEKRLESTRSVEPDNRDETKSRTVGDAFYRNVQPGVVPEINGHHHDTRLPVSMCGGCRGLWELDYATEIFGKYECHLECTEHSDVYWYRGGDMQRVVPDILFHTSDEWCNRAGVVGRYQDFKYVFRQYACHGQYLHQYKDVHNMRVIPLGYMFGMIPTSSAVHARDILAHIGNTRQYRWSFVGHIKSDRSKAIGIFNDVQPNFHGISDKLQTVNVYKDSDFVVSPRGNANLDCFRHYEASMNGAIPVIVGGQQEINNTFGHFISMPPWLFADSWENAKLSVRGLIADRDSLVRRQRRVLEWWLREMRGFSLQTAGHSAQNHSV